MQDLSLAPACGTCRLRPRDVGRLAAISCSGPGDRRRSGGTSGGAIHCCHPKNSRFASNSARKRFFMERPMPKGKAFEHQQGPVLGPAASAISRAPSGPAHRRRSERGRRQARRPGLMLSGNSSTRRSMARSDPSRMQLSVSRPQAIRSADGCSCCAGARVRGAADAPGRAEQGGSSSARGPARSAPRGDGRPGATASTVSAVPASITQTALR